MKIVRLPGLAPGFRRLRHILYHRGLHGITTGAPSVSRKLLKSTAVTGGMTLLSRITGLARDMLFASLIGAGAGVAADAFYVAFRIPNFLRRIFGEFAEPHDRVLVHPARQTGPGRHPQGRNGLAPCPSGTSS